MMDLTKLADELDATAGNNSDMYEHERDSCREAARILRAAAGVDVDKIMAQIRFAITDASMGGEPDTSALESAIRTMAARPGFVMVPVEPTEEMLEAAHNSDREYTLRNFGDIMTVMQGPYDHWCAMIAAAPKGTP